MRAPRVLAGLLMAVGIAITAVQLESRSFDAARDRAAGAFRIEVSFPATLEPRPLDGRVMLVISRRETPEPRFAQMRGLNAQPMFGVDVDALNPGEPAVFDAATRGWPVESLRDISAGD